MRVQIVIVFQMQICIIYNIFEFELISHSIEERYSSYNVPHQYTHNNMSVIIQTVLPNSL